MNSGLYGACAGLIARMQDLDTIAANVSNSSSAGFRGKKDVFATVLAENRRHGRVSPLNQATNAFAQTFNSQIDESQGPITNTGNQLDVAIEGRGYFKIKTNNGFTYTRDGHFQLDGKGRLTNAAGELVIGANGAITLGSLPVTIAGDGIISSGGAISGKLAIVTFPPGTRVIDRGGSQYSAPSSAELPAGGAAIRQGALEGSNVNPLDGIVELVSAQRAAESMRHALSLLDGDMDKTAVQELARVG